MRVMTAFWLAMAAAFCMAVGVRLLAEATGFLTIADMANHIGAGVFLLLIGTATFLPGFIRLIRAGLDDY